MRAILEKIVKKLTFVFVALATALILTPVAKADSFDFTYTGNDGGATGSGTLFATDLGSGEWLIVDASGTFDDGANSGSISLIQNPNAPDASTSPSGFFGYDDLLFPNASVGEILDVEGLLFSFAGMELNLWQSGGGPGTDGWSENNEDSGYGTFSITSESGNVTPEPGSLPLLATGVLALAAVLLRRASAAVPGLNR